MAPRKNTAEKSLPSDHLRCKRTDGRQWRCKRPALEGRSLCEIHQLQGKHRQKKRKVPEHLKLERCVTVSRGKGIKVKKRRVEIKAVRESEALDDALRRMKFKKGDLHLDLLRVYLRRRVEKKKDMDARELKNVSCGGDDDEEDETKVLPYGVMSISRSSKVVDVGQKGGLDVKLGVESNGDPCLMRSFRSKNIEPLPVGTMQVVPFAGMIKKKQLKKCHWCSGMAHGQMVKCLTCRKRFFCAGCIKERDFTKQEVRLKCPACDGNCGCNLCLKQQQGVNCQKERGGRITERIQMLLHLVYFLLPLLKMINTAKSELEAEANVEGKKRKSSIQVSQTTASSIVALSCGRCKTSLVDCHRTCSKCSYNLCLSCCKEISQHNTSEASTLRKSKRRKIQSSSDKMTSIKYGENITSDLTQSLAAISSQIWGSREDGTVCCAPTDMGGCGNGPLNVRFIYPLTWTRELQDRAEEMTSSYRFPDITDAFPSCSLCDKIEGKDVKIMLQREPCKRAIESSLYCPTMKFLHQESLAHFQYHWGKGHPVVVREVLRSNKIMCWDPFTMFCSYMESKSTADDGSNSTQGLDWSEVHIDRKIILMGSLEKKTHVTLQRKFLKFKAWLSSQLFEKQFPIHYSKILSCLPLPDYAHPESGILNVCTKLPDELQKPDLGPCICFSYGAPEDLMQADYLSNLSYELHDTVNILTCATDAPISTEQVNKIENLMKRPKANGHVIGQPKKCKSSLQSDDTGQSGLEDKEEKVLPPNREKEVPFDSSKPPKGQTLNTEDGNLFDDCESDFEESMLCCGSVEKSEDSDEYFQEEDTASSVSTQRADSCGAVWDIFCREDVPKLEEYIRRHSNELRSTCQYSKPAHPILDQNIFLDAYHILKLKNEFDIQPWTFGQCSGEAIFVPAGCPYQIRKVKSCVNVVLNFISPESASHCIQLNEEIRLLPAWHKTKTKVAEVEKMAVHGISTALDDLCKLKSKKSDGE